MSAHARPVWLLLACCFLALAALVAVVLPLWWAAAPGGFNLQALARPIDSSEPRPPWQIGFPSLVVCRYRTTYLVCDKTHVFARDITDEFVRTDAARDGLRNRRREFVVWGRQGYVCEVLKGVEKGLNSMSIEAVLVDLGPPHHPGPDVISRACEGLARDTLEGDPSSPLVYAHVWLLRYAHSKVTNILIGYSAMGYDANAQAYWTKRPGEELANSFEEAMKGLQATAGGVVVEWSPTTGPKAFPSLRSVEEKGGVWRCMETPAGDVVGRGWDGIAGLEGGNIIGGEAVFLGCDVGPVAVLKSGLAPVGAKGFHSSLLEMHILDYCWTYRRSSPATGTGE